MKITSGAFIAFGMEISEFLLLSYTSSLTLAIAGIFKVIKILEIEFHKIYTYYLQYFQEIFQLVLAVVYYDDGDQMSTVNMLGLVMCLSGITCHIVHKFSTSKIIQTIPIISDGGINPTSREQPLQVNYTNYANGNVAKQTMKPKYYSNQHIPLLDSDDAGNTETDDDSQDTQQNASEVIFDILKRRDVHR